MYKMLFSILLSFVHADIPEKFHSLAREAIKSTKYRKLMIDEKRNMFNPGFYEANGIKFRLSKSLIGPSAKEIKGHACDNEYLAIVPNPKYKIAYNFTNTAFALKNKMYMIKNMEASDDSINIYQINEIDPRLIISEVIMYTTNENQDGADTGSTIKSTANFNWDDENNTPVFKPIISAFPNLQFGMGSTVSTAASAKLHSRGTNYIQLDLTLKIEGTFAAGIKTIAGREYLDDIALFGTDLRLWGVSLELFGFEFKAGLFAYIDASISDIKLDTAIDFTFLQGYNFEAYNRIVVCTGFPSPGYTTTGWQSKAEKIDTVNDAKQNGPQDSYATTLSFSPRVDIGLKLGLELPGSTSSWLRAGIRGEIQFEFGADPVSCDFPYLFGKVEPVISLFVGYDGLQILGFEVAPAFETTWDLYRKTIFSKECAFLDVEVSKDYITNEEYMSKNSPVVVDIQEFRTDYDVYYPFYTTADGAHVTFGEKDKFKPVLCTDYYHKFAIGVIKFKDGQYAYSGEYERQLLDGNGEIEINAVMDFNAKYKYRNLSMYYYDRLFYCDKDEFAFSYTAKERFALIQADMTGGFSILGTDDFEYWDDATPNEGWERTKIPFQYLIHGTVFTYYEFETTNNLGYVTIEIFVKHKYGEEEVPYMSIPHQNIGNSYIGFITKKMEPEVMYILYTYVNGKLKDRHEFNAEWLSYYPRNKYKLIDSLYFVQVWQTENLYSYVKIKKPELVGEKRYALITVIDVDAYDRKFRVQTNHDYFLLRMRIGGVEIQGDTGYRPDEIERLTNFAIFLKCPGCFPICKYCETIDEGYYLIKLTINETIDFNSFDNYIQIPMHNTQKELDTEFQITHYLTLNNKGSSQCDPDTVFKKKKLGRFRGVYFSYSCLTPTSEAKTWGAENDDGINILDYTVKEEMEIENRGQTLITIVPKYNENYDIKVTKEYYNYPVNTSNYKRPDVISLYKADRCLSLYAQKDQNQTNLTKTDQGLFYYEPEIQTQEEIDFVCVCKTDSDSFCELEFNEEKTGYYLFESKIPDGITITRNESETYPRGNIKREIVKMEQSPKFWYTKTWDGKLVHYILSEEPNAYTMTVKITVPDGKPDYRKIQLYVSGNGFDEYEIGFDEYRYMNDPLEFLSQLGIDNVTKTGWIYFGDDSEMYLIIEVEPKFNKEWCSKASKMSPIPINFVNSNVKIDCGKGMKWEDDICIVDSPPGWVFWVIIASCIVGALLIIIGIIVVICKCCC